MNIETLIVLCLGGIFALWCAYKLFKFSKNTPIEGEEDTYSGLRPIAKGLALAIVIALIFSAVIKLQHFKVLSISTGSPVAGNELPQQPARVRASAPPEVNVVGGRVTMDEAAVEHSRKLQDFKKAHTLDDDGLSKEGDNK